MIRKLLLLSVVAIAGCSAGRVPTDHLVLLNNDKLCRALGENSDNGDITTRILNEILSRGDSIDLQECYSIERFVKSSRMPSTNDFWFNSINQRDIETMKSMVQMKADGKL
ncbi:hypothetical protein ID853_06610 [Xenorhabdus sp. Vera]|uniref:hypothetical protein n=1 Tax=Xenorhabdus koppenhoeferi TaxID=351659 RepID=UPI0019C4898E|nr:hypothetical protein [Xenorhabdus sp. Vera]MBD2810563.1 hypothetical protein [Xenorhabdus sp. Vera]